MGPRELSRLRRVRNENPWAPSAGAPNQYQARHSASRASSPSLGALRPWTRSLSAPGSQRPRRPHLSAQGAPHDLISISTNVDLPRFGFSCDNETNYAAARTRLRVSRKRSHARTRASAAYINVGDARRAGGSARFTIPSRREVQQCTTVSAGIALAAYHGVAKPHVARHVYARVSSSASSVIV